MAAGVSLTGNVALSIIMIMITTRALHCQNVAVELFFDIYLLPPVDNKSFSPPRGPSEHGPPSDHLQ
jgi:hypothetical protein